MGRRDFLKVASAAAVLLACGAADSIETKSIQPKDEIEQIAFNTLVLYNTFLTSPLIVNSPDKFAVSSVLTSAAVHQESTDGPMQAYRALKKLSWNAFGTATTPPDSEIATLADASVLLQENTTDTAKNFKHMYQKLGGKFYAVLDSTVFSDQETLAINLTALVKSMDEDKVFQTLSDLQKFYDITDNATQNAISHATGPLVLANLLEQQIAGTDSWQNLSNTIKHLNNVLVGASSVDLSTLTLATIFAKGDAHKIIDTYNHFYQQSDIVFDSSISTTLTLASVVDGYDWERVLKIFNFINHYVVDGQTSAQLTLATALHEGKLPPLLQDQQDLFVDFFPIYYVAVLNNSNSDSGTEDSSNGEDGGSDSSGGGEDGGDSGGGGGAGGE